MVDNGIFQCTSCLRCGDVCPQGIYPFEDAIEPLMRIAVTEKAYRMSRHYTAFKEALLESGDVNPLVLMRKVKGIKVVTQLGKGLQLIAKGRLPLRQPENPGLDEIKKTVESTEAKSK